MFSFIPVNAQNKLGAYILEPAALNEFAPNIYTASDANSINQWTQKWNFTRVTEGMMPIGQRYVVYRVNLLAYWFGSFSNDTVQIDALNDLSQIRAWLLGCRSDGM